LIRLLGDFDVAEEALHDAFRSALEQWPRDGVPANPRAWLVSAGTPSRGHCSSAERKASWSASSATSKSPSSRIKVASTRRESARYTALTVSSTGLIADTACDHTISPAPAQGARCRTKFTPLV